MVPNIVVPSAQIRLGVFCTPRILKKIRRFQRSLSQLDGYEGVQDGNRRTSSMYSCLFARVEAGELFRKALFFDWRG